ncbi:MAG TPA: hypothetical protein VM692_16280 [Gammaproteobacteria bacterium]|nr:hypothetical protein [Gammaproteobacteria bacterium]
MTTLTRIGLRAALVAVVGFSWWTQASAQLTPAGTSIQNRATVNYSVGGQPQTLIESSPTGNTAPGAGASASTSFVVDNRIDLTVAELSGNATIASPGAAAAVLAFTVTNTGNAPQGYRLTVAEEVGTLLFGNADNANVGLANLQVRVDEDPSSGNGTGNDAYDGTETATAVDLLNPGASITVFVVVPTVPLTLVNGNFANVNLQAQTAVGGTNGLTLAVQSPGANNPTTVEVVFADDPLSADATENAADQLAIRSAALTVTKTQAVLNDGFGSASPRAIPGASVEYTITVANSSTTTAANGIAISDPIPANTAFQTGLYAGSSDVAITGGAAATCVAETPADTNADGCFRNGGNLVVGGAALGSIAALGNVTVRFQVRIN